MPHSPASTAGLFEISYIKGLTLCLLFSPTVAVSGITGLMNCRRICGRRLSSEIRNNRFILGRVIYVYTLVRENGHWNLPGT